MKKRSFEYPGQDLTVTYDLNRCIHAAECVHGLPGVFDPKSKPWVNPDGAPADEVAAVIQRCPTGALQYTRTDDGPAEAAPGANTVALAPDGPLYVRGDIALETPDGTLQETRVALCRCGASKNKPFCDNSHDKAGFADPGRLGTGGVKIREVEGTALKIKPAENGPLLLEGPVELVAHDAETRDAITTALCRCGASENKPFCDGSHRRIGFVTS